MKNDLSVESVLSELKKNLSKSKIIYIDNTFQVINEMHNFTKEELKNLSVKNLTNQLYIDLCLQGILINKNIQNMKLSNSPKISVIKPIFNTFNSLNYLNYSLIRTRISQI